jgi:hypothetical protein
LFLLFLIALDEFYDHAIVVWLKERLTYPRTGYVPREEHESASPFIQLSLENKRMPEEEGLRWFRQLSLRTAIIATVLTMPFLIWATVLGEQWNGMRWVEAAFFLVMGIARLKGLDKDKLVYIDVFGFVLAGVAVAAFPINRVMPLFLAPGIVFTARGAIKLLLYLHRNPVAQS